MKYHVKETKGKKQGGGVLMAFLLDFMGLHPHPSAYQQSIYSKRKKEKLHPVWSFSKLI